MADQVSVRPTGRRAAGLTDGARPPGRRARLSLAARLAAAVLLTLASLLPGTALAATGLDISTPYPAVAVAPGSDVSFEISVSTATAGRVNLALEGVPQGWTATLRGGGFVVDGVQTTGDEPATVTLEIEVPAEATGTNNITVRATSGSLTTDLPLTLRIEAEAAGEVTLTTSVPSVRGASDATFSFNLDLNNDTPEDLTFVVEAQVQAAGPGWEATAQVSGQEQAASTLVEAGATATIDVEVTAPENVAAGTYPIVVTATSGSNQVAAELAVEITGSYAMTLSTPDERLNVRGAAGSEIRQTIQIENTGTSPLEGLQLTATQPQGWSVDFEPAEVPPVAAGGEPAVVTAIIRPSGSAIAGDYEVVISASGDTAGEEALALRVTVETSLLWGVIGVAIIVAVFAGLWWVFQRYGRR